mmetsp:Transcript_25164/g.18951  ORF Transcript_25164/g.18951 Transcript_25164/m.18951 type:complete len:103 (+) Transcript_25164:461-769(+)
MISICSDYFLEIKWKQSRKLLHEKDTVWNTGEWKLMTLELLGALVTNNPLFHNKTYQEPYNERVVGIEFQWNDLLLGLMLFTRFHYLVRATLSFTSWTDPRS